MSQLLLSAAVNDVVGLPKTMTGPCTVMLEGTIGTATVNILIGRVGETRSVVAFFDADDDVAANFVEGRGRARRIDMPPGVKYDISANVLGTGDQNVTVSVLN